MVSWEHVWVDLYRKQRIVIQDLNVKDSMEQCQRIVIDQRREREAKPTTISMTTH
ncbi:hypothetical protein M513_06898 [Trichuris suis]|uniref:Uncharacterized protein n=1 Tax=Trichuris suis TaxID=68888 RepID=A0A085M4N9_9BILA|nr:hypothetical protein M513_06898 [Trichuris suis]